MDSRTLHGQNDRHVILAGTARLPSQVAPLNGSVVVHLELEVNESDGTIARVGVTGVPPLAAELLYSLLVGRSMQAGVDPVIQEIREHYRGPTQRALAAAVHNVFAAYEERQRPDDAGRG